MNDLIAIDTETGGTNPRRHALLSIGAATLAGARFHRYILPIAGAEIDPEAAAVNGYSSEKWEARGAVGLFTAMLEFREWLTVQKKGGARVPLAHNASFDRMFLMEADRIAQTKALDVLDYRWECSMSLLSSLMRAGLVPRGPAKLDRLAELAGLPRAAVHDAQEDALVCLFGYDWLTRQVRDHVSLSAQGLIQRLSEDLRLAEREKTEVALS